MQNVFNAVVTGGGSPWDDSDIGDDAELWMDDLYLNVANFVSDECSGTMVTIYKYDAIDDDWDEVVTKAWVYAFQASEDQLPRGNAALVNAKTTDPDVSGKKYIGGLTEAAITGGLLNGGTLNAITAWAIDWYTPFTGGESGATWTPGVWSVKNTVFKALSGTLITSSVMAYQRRRKRGVGI
jgi:hypothetical protein